jgi:hypothetical protein
LIAAIWPEGRGNVSHGANVGANHSSRAPDQEARLGEGTFLGLGVNVKYPIDLSQAPYCFIACGVTLPPQRILYPFSLVNVSSAHRVGVPTYYNEIVPGWGLAENLYALKRTVGKHQSRNHARRNSFTFEIFRPAIVNLIQAAYEMLASVAQVRDIYTDRHLGGLGKNYLTEEHRQQAMWTYRFHTRLYALLGLFERALAAAGERRWWVVERLLDVTTDDPVWEHQRGLLTCQLRVGNVAEGLRELPDLLERVSGDIERSKERDDIRGPRIIEDYADIHILAGNDPLIEHTRRENRQIQEKVEYLVECLDGNGIARSPAVPVLVNGAGHVDAQLYERLEASSVRGG